MGMCCVWFICRALPRLPRDVRKRSLMLRQLKHLAWADLLMAIGGIAMLGPKFVYDFIPSNRVIVCFVGYYICWSSLLLGLLASLLFEAHLAATIAVNAWRAQNLRDGLRHALPWLWLLALVLTMSDLLQNIASYNDAVRTCLPLLPWNRPVIFVLAGLSMIANVSAYLALLRAPQLKESNAPDVIVRRAKIQVC